MGVWSEKIKDNDTTLDIYSNFFERYNSGETPASISESIWEEYEDYFNDSDDRNNSLIGLALAQWETKSLEPQLFEQIREIITSGNDLKIWEDLGADEKSLIKRQKELEKFLTLISEERSKPKRRVKPKFGFTTNEVLRSVSLDKDKELVIQDEYTNGNYVHTSGVINWFSGGGAGIFYHNKPNSPAKAVWVDNQTLKVIHEPDLKFEKKDSTAFFSGDQITLEYQEN